MHEAMVFLGFQPFRFEDVAPYQQGAKHDNGNNTGDIQGNGKQFVKSPLEKFYAEEEI